MGLFSRKPETAKCRVCRKTDFKANLVHDGDPEHMRYYWHEDCRDNASGYVDCPLCCPDHKGKASRERAEEHEQAMAFWQEKEAVKSYARDCG